MVYALKRSFVNKQRQVFNTKFLLICLVSVRPFSFVQKVEPGKYSTLGKGWCW